MKIAVCISGQPRSIKAGYAFLKKNMLDYQKMKQHKVDVFLHSWADKHSIDNRDFSHFDMYAADTGIRGAKLSTPLNKENITKKFPNIDNPAYPAYNTYSMWYSVAEANNLKREYELSNGMEYDVVVRTRFDFALNRVFDFETYDLNKIHVPNCRMVPGNNFCSDMFAFGSSKVMNLYSNTFSNIEYFYDRGITMNGEHMLSANLQVYNLVGPNLVYVDMNNPFPPGKYNGNRHSIIRDDFQQWNDLR
jgi:hypothetical protein